MYKVIHPKCYKKCAYDLVHEMSFVCTAYFGPKKYSLTKKIAVSSLLLLINFFIRTLQCTERLILYLFCEEKKTLKSRYFSKIAKIFQYCQNGPICPTRAKVQDSFEFLQHLRYISLMMYSRSIFHGSIFGFFRFGSGSNYW